MNTLEQVYYTKGNYIRKAVWSWYKYQPELIEDVTQEFWLWLAQNIHKYSNYQISFDRWLRMHLIYFLQRSRQSNRAFHRTTHSHYENVADLQLHDNTQDNSYKNVEDRLTINKLAKTLKPSQQRVLTEMLKDNDLKDLSRIFRYSKQNTYKRFNVIKNKLRGINV